MNRLSPTFFQKVDYKTYTTLRSRKHSLQFTFDTLIDEFAGIITKSNTMRTHEAGKKHNIIHELTMSS